MRKKMRVAQFERNGNLIKIYESINGAGNESGISCRNIFECLYGNRKTAGGFRWTFVDDEDLKKVERYQARKRECENRIEYRKNKLGKQESLCWSCRKALFGCPWSIDFKPVDGWEAEEHNPGYFRVYDCPLFVRG